MNKNPAADRRLPHHNPADHATTPSSVNHRSTVPVQAEASSSTSIRKRLSHSLQCIQHSFHIIPIRPSRRDQKARHPSHQASKTLKFTQIGRYRAQASQVIRFLVGGGGIYRTFARSRSFLLTQSAVILNRLLDFEQSQVRLRIIRYGVVLWICIFFAMAAAVS